MAAKLVCLLLTSQLHLLLASDLHVVPTWNYSSSEENTHLVNHDRVVPQINISPLGVHHDSKFPLVVDSNEEDQKFKSEKEDSPYPTPRPRIQEIDEKIEKGDEPKAPAPTPRARIQESTEDLNKDAPDSLEDKSKSANSKIIRDEPRKPFETVYHSKPAEIVSPDSDEDLDDNVKVKGQPEVVLVIEDIDSAEDENETKEGQTDKLKAESEDSVEKMQRYIDEIDQAYKGKILPSRDVQEKIADPALGIRKYVVKDISDYGRLKREAVKQAAPKPIDKPVDAKVPQVDSKPVDAKVPQTDVKVPQVDGGKVSNERKTSGGLAYNVEFEAAKSAKPEELSPRPKRDTGKITNERKTSGGLAYNVELEPAKAAKPQLSPRTKRENTAHSNIIFDQDKSEAFPKVTSAKDNSWIEVPKISSEGTSESLSSEEEMTRPDQQLPKLDLPADEDKTFSEVLHKTVKESQKKTAQDEQNKNGVLTQDVNRLPHRGPTIKNPSPFLAIDPPVSGEEKSAEKEDNETIPVIVIEKTIVLEDDTDDSNKSQNVYIENADLNFNMMSSEMDEDKEEPSFWQNGFTIGLHISPLALCLGTALILFALLMRLALKLYKQRLQNSVVLPTSHEQHKKSAQFDSISLSTVA